MTDTLVEARGLTKRFDDLTAVDGIDFDIHQGEAFGFLGPNGAGKTSTMKMITTVSPIT
ncbi:MAG: ATP-binding cassette domain-containing protein, partial [Acidobacteria bacterium]